MPADVTETVDGRFAFTCTDHPAWDRVVDSAQHALNTLALHNRVDHADDTDSIEVDLTAAAQLVVDLEQSLRSVTDRRPSGGSTAQKKAQGRLGGALSIWEALTGVTGPQALALAREIADAPVPLIAAVAPF